MADDSNHIYKYRWLMDHLSLPHKECLKRQVPWQCTWELEQDNQNLLARDVLFWVSAFSLLHLHQSIGDFNLGVTYSYCEILAALHWSAVGLCTFDNGVKRMFMLPNFLCYNLHWFDRSVKGSRNVWGGSRAVLILCEAETNRVRNKS